MVTFRDLKWSEIVLKIKISKATIIRLSLYLRYLTEVDHKGITLISSYDIAKGIGVNPASVRKDLAYFGDFGTRGLGYNVKDLRNQIIKILGLSNEWNAALVGLGNLGLALSTYKGFRERGFIIDSIFDTDSSKIGSIVNGTQVLPVEQMEEVLSKRPTEIGIICVPISVAQVTADALVRAGVKAILNFAPVALNVPPEVSLRNVDLAVNLEIITFNLGIKELTDILIARSF